MAGAAAATSQWAAIVRVMVKMVPKNKMKKILCVSFVSFGIFFVVRSVRRVRCRASFIGDRFRIERC